MDEADDEDIAIDASGYTGNFHRNIDEKSLEPCTMEELAAFVCEKNRLVDIMRSIKDIDKEHNGYVTSTELDDIVKIYYKKELSNKNLKHLFRPFASI